MRRAVYPGSFDPVTNGHIDILERSVKLFDELIVAVSVDNSKTCLFSLEERIEMLEAVTRNYPNVVIEHFSGLLMHYTQEKKACAIVRGLRAVSDFEYEFQMALMNKNLANEIETVFLMTSSENAFISSTMIKQVSSLNGKIKGLVPELVRQRLRKKYDKI
ncbi:MAG: pantetheine-phosphate adenylyltransferase [Clostridia bacterium]